MALPSTSDYIKASTNPKCTSLANYYYSGDGACFKNSENHNWLYQVLTNNDTKIGWLLTPGQDVYTVFCVTGQSGREGSIDRAYARGSSNLHASPTIYLGHDLLLTGDGTKDKPYIIK